MDKILENDDLWDDWYVYHRSGRPKYAGYPTRPKNFRSTHPREYKP